MARDAFATLEALNARIPECDLCPRLRAHCTSIAQVKRRAYLGWEYWGRPVPSFGDPQARVLALGLAPGAHGSNRTGRPFTGDGSGDFLYPVLHEAGFASQANSDSRVDGMRLTDLWITSVARCAPPDNKPTPEELRNCAPWLDRELSLLKNLRVVVCLGRIAFEGLLAHEARRLAASTNELSLDDTSPSTTSIAKNGMGKVSVDESRLAKADRGKSSIGKTNRVASRLNGPRSNEASLKKGKSGSASAAKLPPRSSFIFAHGAEFTLPSGLIAITSYHPSLQNTNTGKLTRPMLLKVFRRARILAEQAA